MLVLLILILRTALSATLALPANEAPLPWVAPARLAGFSLTGPAQPADVVCIQGPSGWTIRVEGVDGTIRSERVPSPTDERAREDLAWLASSLLSEVEAKAGEVRPVLPSVAARALTPPKPIAREPAPRPLPPPPRIAPPAAAATPPAPDVDVVAPASASADSADSPDVDVVAPPDVDVDVDVDAHVDVAASASADGADGTDVDADALRPYLASSLLYTRRAGLSSSLHLSLQTGALLPHNLLLGLAATLPYSRTVDDTEGTLRSFDLLGQLRWTPDLRLAPELGLGAGISTGTWSESGEKLHTRLVPLAALDAGLGLRLHSALRLTAGAKLSREIARTEIQVGEDAPATLSPWQTSLSLSLRGQIP